MLPISASHRNHKTCTASYDATQMYPAVQQKDITELSELDTMQLHLIKILISTYMKVPCMCQTRFFFFFFIREGETPFCKEINHSHPNWHLSKKRKKKKKSVRTIFILTGGNWQKWKRVFLTCPCHKIFRDEAVGLKSCKYTWKITKFVKMGNLGQYRENLIFCQ